MGKDYTRLIKELRGLANGEVQPVDHSLGICHHVQTKLKINGSIIMNVARKWPKTSGAYMCPIKGFYTERNLWKGKQLELRKDLCAFIADYLESGKTV